MKKLEKHEIREFQNLICSLQGECDKSNNVYPISPSYYDTIAFEVGYVEWRAE